MPLEGTTQPQLFLDRLRKIGVPELFVPNKPPRTRQNLLQAVQTELETLDNDMQAQIEAIRQRYVGKRRKRPLPAEAERELAPYDVVYKLLQRVRKDVNNLEASIQAGRMLPRFEDFPEYIFGDPETNEWFLGELGDMRRWEDTQTLKSRMVGLVQQRDPLVEQIKAKKAEVATAKAAYEKLQVRYEQRKTGRAIITRLLLWFVLALLAAGVAASVFFATPASISEQQRILYAGTAASLGAFVLVIVMPVTYVLWRNGVRRLEQKVQDARSALSARRAEGKELQSRYLPVVEMLRSTRAEYDDMRATFDPLAS
jgi:uncharacterized integral membrane protein